MTNSRLNILRKGLIGPELDQLQRSVDQKIMLSNDQIKTEMLGYVTKNEFYIKDKLSIIDELILQIDTLQRQVKTN